MLMKFQLIFLLHYKLYFLK